MPDQAFLAGESGSTWGNAEQVPGLRALGSRDSSVSFMFCGRSDRCVALGGYVARPGFVKGHIFTLTRS